MILNGKDIAESIYSQLSKHIKTLGTIPKLGAILVGNDSVSLRYIRQKKKFAEKVGIEFELFQLQEDIKESELIKEIQRLNQSDEISGYIIQLPLPPHIDTKHILSHIDPKKDVDGFHPENQGKVLIGDSSGLIPCTPAGIMKIFDFYDISLLGKRVTILGQSNIVGKPMAQLCINAGATVTSCNSKTPDISLYTKNSDIIICATGVKHLLTKELVSKNSTIIIDVGFSIIDGNIYGDAEYEALLQAGHTITPVPGGVGPMTVAMLLSNTLKAHGQK